MPIPEPARYKPSNLTKEQRKSQTAAVYGVPMQEFTHEEIERMRAMVQSHDAQRSPVQTIDLNNPPRQPYHYQKFPKMVYDLENSIPGSIVSRVVRNEEEFEAALADGYSKDAPPFGQTPEERLSPQYQNEVSRVQEQLETVRRRRKSEVA